jgi:hypothetical protein
MSFTKSIKEWGIDQPSFSNGSAYADFDNDGDLDICLTGGAGVDTKLWRNDSNNSNNWITLKLEGDTSNKSAIGARIEVTAGGVTTVKEVSGGAGRGSFNSLPVEFGLGSTTSVSNVKIVWPSGNTENFDTISINQISSITEGSSTLSVDDLMLSKTLNIFPNPFKDIFTVDLSQFNDESTIKIYTILGEVIYEDITANSKVNIEIKNGYKGLLYVTIESNNSIFVRKIIKY